ncbi:tRNA pseudouridine(55) synthase TruB [Candidatus Aerophobetes bacterium]|uniref:tRNA pseudouridine synthase B n=1 Tax=Aerophobetes bacterium TaxID=2030807 RepID=A0A2A4X668_UNCAE|nr:MAG: tRNA pseudouridine(55) synthase TruB [Candidatus Aerophobetes bacterium]
MTTTSTYEGVLPVAKPKGKTSFYLIKLMRKVSGIKKIGHTGTLDPFATGVMVLLLGRTYTKQCDALMANEKEYEATFRLGICTDTQDVDGTPTETSSKIPTLEEVNNAIAKFQGSFEQLPPMYSAKKIGGKRLYTLAREGITVERKKSLVTAYVTLISYTYPYLKVGVKCSKGTYIRTLGYDIGQILGCGAYTQDLARTKNGSFTLSDCFEFSEGLIERDSFLPFLLKTSP